MSLPRALVVLVLTSGALGACGTPRDTTAGPASPARPVASGAPATAAASATTSATTGGDTASVADEPPPLALEEVTSGLSAPINVETAADDWLLVNERNGRVVAVHARTGETATALDLTDRVHGGGEQGLLGLALHPDWPSVGRAFVHYTDRSGDTVLAELAGAQSEDDAPLLDRESERLLLRIDQPYPNHNGGQLAFGPDGMLYVGLGDGGAGGDPHGHGQDASTLLGSILRLDVADPGRYSVPADNPFADGGGAPEVHLYGLRNPWRFSFDGATGLLWIADVGQNAWEEIDRVDPADDAGANLGWAVMEASHCFADVNCSADGLVLPVAEYGRELGCSVTGGHVYRGDAIRDLAGWYLFSDYCSGLLFGIRSDATELAAPRILLETDANVSAFGRGSDGELYLTDLEAGVLYRVVAGG